MISERQLTLNPRELKIEVTGACNLACSFCYQDKQGIGQARHSPEEQVLGWIDWAVDNGLPTVRFTGGEPTLHPAIRMLCNYAHLRGRRLIVNTNGLAPAGLYDDLLRVVDFFCLSLPVLDAARLDQISGGRGALGKKLDFLRQALAAGRPVALLTPLLPENKGRLVEFVDLVRKHPGAIWSPLRLKPTPRDPRPWTRRDAQDFALEVAGLMDHYPAEVKGIHWATPFCAVEPLELGARVFHGWAEQCGPHRSLAVGLEGGLRACYGARQTLRLAPLAELLQGPDLGGHASLASLPEVCQGCAYVWRCAGGCRGQLGLVRRQGGWVDHLASL
jgi:radical SAM protein with 4Fe4S-binding SPASM domain